MLNVINIIATIIINFGYIGTGLSIGACIVEGLYVETVVPTVLLAVCTIIAQVTKCVVKSYNAHMDACVIYEDKDC